MHTPTPGAVQAAAIRARRKLEEITVSDLLALLDQQLPPSRVRRVSDLGITICGLATLTARVQSQEIPWPHIFVVCGKRARRINGRRVSYSTRFYAAVSYNYTGDAMVSVRGRMPSKQLRQWRACADSQILGGELAKSWRKRMGR